MTRLRHALRSHPLLAALLLAAALLLRVLVPAGFMPGMVDGGATLVLCSGIAPAAAPTMTMPRMAHHDDADRPAQSPCAYADLALPALGDATPALLILALAFALALSARLVVPLPPFAPARLRPPLRGPPVPA